MVLLASLAFISCADESEEQPEHDIAFCVRAAWLDGLSDGKTTRALTATDILADGTHDIAIDYADYPEEISVSCKKGETEVLPLTLTKSSAICSEHEGYWAYTPSFLFRDQLIKREDYGFYATAVIDEDGTPDTPDDGDRLEGYADKNNIDGTHLMLTLHHTKALLRFAFKVSEKYDKVRYIRVTNINLNGTNCTLVDKVLTQSNQLIAYAYIDPKEVTTSKENNIQCTYNIYDKDSATDADLTRKGVVAKNKFTLGSIKDSSDSNVSSIKAGYYYDLNITINPDYLYVLSEHDNKHITIE
ncbi:MAG: hypothetical protein KBT29_11895 [Prevotellaceae bacterium]|nr:hypothetical protein [Candidatus Minthosoma caballi]